MMRQPWIAGPGFDSANVAITGGSITGQTGTPYILAQSFAAVNTPADTTEDTLATIPVPANALGANGALRITHWWEMTNNVNAKTARVRYSGGAGTVYFTSALANNSSGLFVTYIFNKNATNSQSGGFANANATLGTNGLALVTSAVDTTAATTLVFTGQKGAAGDTLTLDGYIVELIRFS